MNNKSSPFASNNGFRKGIKDDPPTRMVYLFCEDDQQSEIAHSKQKGIYLNAKLVDTENGPKAFTRSMLLTEENFQRGSQNGVQNIANLSRGERVVSVELTSESSTSRAERMQIDVFMKSGYNRESDGAELTA